jgi:hypothetical protein
MVTGLASGGGGKRVQQHPLIPDTHSHCSLAGSVSIDAKTTVNCSPDSSMGIGQVVFVLFVLVGGRFCIETVLGYAVHRVPTPYHILTVISTKKLHFDELEMSPL